MPFLTGSLILDCPASALNNGQAEASAATDNTVPVKKIRTAQGPFAYVSAQAVRYWLRTTLEKGTQQWKAAPVHRETKVAYTDAEPIEWWDDDLFGYMRAPSKKADAKKGAGAAPLEKDRDITRVSPLRVSTFVSVAPAAITNDWGTMSRLDGDPVPFEHEFFRGHLAGAISLDLTAAGTFFDGERVGFRNLDSHRRQRAISDGLEKIEVRRQQAYRLAFEQRAERVSTLIRGFGMLSGGAKQALHYTDLTPAVFILAITKHGNNPFLRLFHAGKDRSTQFHREAFEEMFRTYSTAFLSPVMIGWQRGFLDDERSKLEAALKDHTGGDQFLIGHPLEIIEGMAKALEDRENRNWYE